ncbi:glycosyltransferase family 87 protein [Chitinophaga japonensis]|uniref:Uncharacterized protein DUF2029 n=1 Tax=Chitinophaga japonensis TaxID=104662 RepID=A0A562TEV4_CHIJA|nr:glycosyltransferase family 87 protein [Chitinophaga japonensis]TWI92015.1 uncharacterized protein DUF2029 [Chitinophaga japonensis]
MDKHQQPAKFFINLGEKISLLPVRYLFLFFLLMAAGISCHAWFSSQDMEQWTRYNNFVIFKQSFFHLLHYQDLYTHYPAEHYDVYKYSPSFALWMGLFAWLPDLPGLILFNLLNMIVLLAALRRLPVAKERFNLLLLFILIETMISLTSSQTNVLIAGLLILAWHLLENDRPWWAALLIVVTVYIKLFGVVAFALFLLYPSRWKAAIATLCWLIVLGLMPLLVVSPAQLQFLYKSWGDLLTADHGASYGVSLYGWWHTWFGFDMNKQVFVLLGAGLFCLPLLRVRAWRQPLFRLLMLASVLIWVVIFNHKGESPTYIIAMTGIAIWYFTQRPGGFHLVLLLLALVCTSFSSTDLIFPYKLARTYVEPYAVKAVFCSVIWFVLIAEQLKQLIIKN